MGRGKVELKRIDNNISRQVTFSKRRAGLLKKAQELSILCDAEIALIIFSTRGRLYHFSSFGPSPRDIDKTLERYQRCSVTPLATYGDNGAATEIEMSWCQEVQRLKANYESLKETQRHLLGEDLGPLNVKQLENLEKQLESALTQARHRKMQLMTEQMESLRRKGRELGDLNKELTLKSQIEEGVATGQFRMMNPQYPWGFGASAEASSSFSGHPSHSATTALDCDSAALQVGYKPEPILEIGYQCYAAEDEGPSNPRNMPTDFHGWFH